MQVTLEPVIWHKLTAFANAEDFFAWLWDEEASLAPEGFDALAAGWRSDSAREYLGVAEALEAIVRIAPPDVQQVLQHGICRLISTNENVDEFGTSPASDYAYWLSASPGTTRAILDAVRSTDWAEVGALAPDGIDIMPMIDQHEALLLYAVEHGCGLLGHIG